MATFEENEYQAEDDIVTNGRAGGESGAGTGAGGSMSNGYVIEGNVVNVDLSAPADVYRIDVLENER